MGVRCVRAILGVAIAAAALAAGCGDDGDGGGREDGLRVVATTTVIAELARHVAGDDAEVVSLIPPGVDVHSFEPTPQVARSVAEADVLLVNGYNIEERLLDIVRENRDESSPVVVVSAGLEVLEGEEHEGEEHDEEDDAAAADGDFPALATAEGDPHLFLDVSNAIRYVENIRDALVAADAEHADEYESRAADYIDELTALDAEIRETMDAIPANARKLVVFHDSFQYFARAYGFELTASVLPASAQQETSAGEVADIIELVRAEGIRAVYREPQFASTALDAIAEETGASVLVLYSDATTTDSVDSYVAMMRANADALAEGLRP